MEGRSPDAITAGIEAAYAQGRLPRRDRVTFAYMWSAHQHLGPGIDAWRPHMMVFAPYYSNAMSAGTRSAARSRSCPTTRGRPSAWW